MRVPLIAAVLLATLFAGCTGTGAPESPITHIADACDLGICSPTDADMEEVDVQPNAVPVVGFHADDVASVGDVVRLDGGWGFTLRDTGGRWHLVNMDEASHRAQRSALSSGVTVTTGSLFLAEGRLLATTSVPGETTGVTLHSWDLQTDEITTTELPDLPTPAYPRGTWNDDILLVAPKGLLRGDSSAWVLRGDDLLPIQADGRVMDAAMVTGLLYLVVEKDGVWQVESHGIDGGHVLTHWTGNASIGGVWGNDGHVAFSVILDTSDPRGGQLHEIDHFTHKVSRMGNGWDVRFVGGEVHYVTAASGTSPFLAQWSRVLQAYSEGAFLPDGNRWTVAHDGVWWLEVPRTDHRYKETANPSPFTVMLMTYDR